MNLTLSNKNPFSTFDFLGYFFPGALTLFLLYIISDGFNFEQSLRPVIVDRTMIFVKTNEFAGLFVYILASYVVGHILAYISSVTIELFYVWCYGYPTQYLFQEGKQKGILATDFKHNGTFLHVLVCLCIFPIVICHCVCERCMNIREFIIRPLDSQVAKRIKLVVINLCHKMGGVEGDCAFSHTDIHRVIMHYVYEHCKMHQSKFDNYVALYGFLRSVCLSFTVAFIYMLYRYYRYTFYPRILELQINVCIMMEVFIGAVILFILLYVFIRNRSKSMPVGDKCLMGLSFWFIFINLSTLVVTWGVERLFGMLIGMFLLLFAAYISYLGFAKFYRRFTVENFMALLTCEELYPHQEEKTSVTFLSNYQSTPIEVHVTSDSVLMELIKKIRS